MNFNALENFFARFVRRRAIGRHFRRRAILETFTRTGVSQALPQALAQPLVTAAQSDAATLLARLHTHFDGLAETQATTIRQQTGPNEIEHEKPLSWWLHLWRCYTNPFSLLLTLLASVSWLTDDMKATVVISSMVLLSTLIRFWQERKSNKAADKLKEMVSNTATVLRPALASAFSSAPAPTPAHKIELPIKLLVPGDVVVLSAGDMIPADLRLLSAKDLFINQAAMTGESMPVEKFAHLSKPETTNPLDLDNILFMGTNVVSGSATAVVVATGNKTYFGALAQRVTAIERAPTAFQTGVNQVSWLLIRFMLVMSPLVLFVNGFTKGDWLEALLFALSIAVGLTPEMLPMIVTSTL